MNQTFIDELTMNALVNYKLVRINGALIKCVITKLHTIMMCKPEFGNHFTFQPDSVLAIRDDCSELLVPETSIGGLSVTLVAS